MSCGWIDVGFFLRVVIDHPAEIEDKHTSNHQTRYNLSMEDLGWQPGSAGLHAHGGQEMARWPPGIIEFCGAKCLASGGSR